jgi:hypothetical protein
MGSFKKAVKQDLKLRLGITGPAGAGKTFTALRIAGALGGPIAYLDTEHGSASKYADLFEFDVMEMRPPFNPQRFVAGIQAAAGEGYNVIVIDSLSHAWNGTGGILEMVEDASARTKGNSYAAWKTVTPVQNDLIEAIVHCPIHIISCMRSKMEYLQTKDDKGYTRIEKMGMAPIQRDGFEYEFDIVLDMNVEHQGVVSKTRCPALTGKVFKLPGEDVAGIIKDWLHSGSAQEDVAKAKAVEPVPQGLAAEESFPNASERKQESGGVGESKPAGGGEEETISRWSGPTTAQQWAIAVGACDNINHAQQAWIAVVKECGGFTPANKMDVYSKFYRERMAKVGTKMAIAA